MDERIRKKDSEMPGGCWDDTGGTGRACGDQLEVSADDVMLDVLRVGRKARCIKLEEKHQRQGIYVWWIFRRWSFIPCRSITYPIISGIIMSRLTDWMVKN